MTLRAIALEAASTSSQWTDNARFKLSPPRADASEPFNSYKEKQTGRAAADCRNNFVWIEHDNGEWTNYSHLAHGSVTQQARRKVGDWVEAGDFIGIEGTVGCSMLDHVHFEVATPDAEAPIDTGGFLLDNEGNKRLRTPRFCNVAEVIKESVHRARPCPEARNTTERRAPDARRN
jgi:hypothetical protein